MTGKKRKRPIEEDDRPAKKVALESPPGAATVKISFVDDHSEWNPVIASTPGISLPSNIPLKAYQKTDLKPQSTAILPPGYKAPTPKPELLLYSSAHPQINYTGREEGGNSSASHLKHYVGVYDPKTGELQVIEAKKLTIRGTLRKEDQELRREDDEQKLSVSLSLIFAIRRANRGQQNQTARQNLGMEFGTKKAKKAIASQTENAISPSKPRATSPGGSQTPAIQDAATKALLDAMADSTDHMATRAELQSAVDEAKPRPKANLAAKTPADVYPVESLVGEETMAALTVKDWQDTVEAGEAVTGLKSRYVSQRLQKVATSSGSGKVVRLKVLRYISLLLDFYLTLNTGARGPKRVPQMVHLKKALGVQGSLVDTIKRRFAPESTLTKWHIDNLITHIAALSLLVDNFEVDVYHLKEDLKLDNKQSVPYLKASFSQALTPAIRIAQYYHEIGCQVKLPTEAERNRAKLSKAEASVHKIAKLKIPLDFPKQRMIKAAKRR
ncbi:MAG: DNA-directed RNA polymerase I subunit rpa49 [Candelina submexicana]|nr:MAG: DNA-directed RNA polymerase I subunit rpa49 [Candelina submexicana]